MLERKRWVATCGLLIPLLLIAAPHAQALVIVDSATYGGHFYYVLSPATWLDSEAAAVLLGGHLVTIDDAAENDFVRDRFGVSGGIFAQRQDLWIGLTDQAQEGTFAWASGAPLAYTNWLLGEPNDCALLGGVVCTSEDFAHMPWWGTPLGGWNDLPNDLGLIYGVAELNSAIPEPSSLLFLGLGLAAMGRLFRRRR